MAAGGYRQAVAQGLQFSRPITIALDFTGNRRMSGSGQPGPGRGGAQRARTATADNNKIGGVANEH